MTAKTIETKVNSTWKALCQKRHIPKNIQRSYLSSNTNLPQFYHLVKTHKLQQGIKIRPIVSNCYGPTKRLSRQRLLANLLKPFSKDIPAHLENSLELILNIQTSNHIPSAFFHIPSASTWYLSIHPSLFPKQLNAPLIESMHPSMALPKRILENYLM